MSEIELLTQAINGLKHSNDLLIRQFESKPVDPVFITTLELQDRWRCKYAVINSQMKDGLKPCKLSSKKMMFRLSVVKEWENENF